MARGLDQLRFGALESRPSSVGVCARVDVGRGEASREEADTAGMGVDDVKGAEGALEERILRRVARPARVTAVLAHR